MNRFGVGWHFLNSFLWYFNNCDSPYERNNLLTYCPQLSTESLHIPRGERGSLNLTFTVPFPCKYKDAVHIDEIDDDECPLHIELALPTGSGQKCESRLTGESRCGVVVKPKAWNETHVIKVVHQDNDHYILTLAEAERKLYLRTYEFLYSKIWSFVLLPVVNVIISQTNDTLNICFIAGSLHLTNI